METGPREDVAAEVGSFLGEAFRAMGLEVSITAVEADAEAVTVRTTGPDRDLLLQDRAELLEAFQYLASRIFAGRLGGRRVLLDCDGYRKRKEEELRQIARRVAEKVRRTGREEALGRMNPYERRIVHLAVAEEPGVTSESVGEGFLKRVVVRPGN